MTRAFNRQAGDLKLEAAGAVRFDRSLWIMLRGFVAGAFPSGVLMAVATKMGVEGPAAIDAVGILLIKRQLELKHAPEDS